MTVVQIPRIRRRIYADPIKAQAIGELARDIEAQFASLQQNVTTIQNITNLYAASLGLLAVPYAAVLTLDVSAHRDFEVGALTGNCAITLVNGADGSEGLINVVQDTTGGRTVTIAATGRTVVRSTSLGSLTALATASAQTIYWYRFHTVGAVAYLQVSMDYLA